MQESTNFSKRDTTKGAKICCCRAYAVDPLTALPSGRDRGFCIQTSSGDSLRSLAFRGRCFLRKSAFLLFFLAPARKNSPPTENLFAEKHVVYGRKDRWNFIVQQIAHKHRNYIPSVGAGASTARLCSKVMRRLGDPRSPTNKGTPRKPVGVDASTTRIAASRPTIAKRKNPTKKMHIALKIRILKLKTCQKFSTIEI